MLCQIRLCDVLRVPKTGVKIGITSRSVTYRSNFGPVDGCVQLRFCRCDFALFQKQKLRKDPVMRCETHKIQNKTGCCYNPDWSIHTTQGVGFHFTSCSRFSQSAPSKHHPGLFWRPKDLFWGRDPGIQNNTITYNRPPVIIGATAHSWRVLAEPQLMACTTQTYSFHRHGQKVRYTDQWQEHVCGSTCSKHTKDAHYPCSNWQHHIPKQIFL